MLFDLIDLAKLRRAIVYGLLLAAVFILQNLICSRIALLGVRALFVPVAVVAIGMFEGGVWGGLLGLVAGYFCDLGFCENTILFTVLFPALGFFSGAFSKYFLHRGFLTFLVLSAVALLIVSGCQMFRFLFFVDTNKWTVLKTGLLQVLWSLPFAVVVYYPCQSIAGHGMRELGN